MNSLRILFVKETQNWPRSSGNDVHGYHLMKALAARGHAISLATVLPPTEQALEGLALESLHLLEGLGEGRLPLSFLERRFVSYYGVHQELGVALGRLVCEREFDAVILVARNLLPWLKAIRGPVRVWYPADDPAWHHLTRVKLLKTQTWHELLNAAINVVYERAFRPCYDRVWVVSPADKTAIRVFAGCRAVDLMPNGVDADYYNVSGEATIPASCVFWGRLDFDPNVDALEWFISRVWPSIVKRTPAARFAVFGFKPLPRVKELAREPGVELHPDLPDLRPEVVRRQVVVLPFVTGAGIKNKLLEAAAMGMPIVCTRVALSGTKGKAPVQVCRSPAEWAESLANLWESRTARQELGASARMWVSEHHTWEAVAQTAEQGIRQTMERQKADGSNDRLVEVKMR
jgi:glycosyltransferase involved in cell wall biosynthesis